MTSTIESRVLDSKPKLLGFHSPLPIYQIKSWLWWNADSGDVLCDSGQAMGGDKVNTVHLQPSLRYRHEL
jgi:hypothetical protein